MSKDYAKIIAKSRAANKQGRYGRLLFIFSLMILTAASMYWVFTKKPNAWLQKAQAFFHHKPAAQPSTQVAEAPKEQQPDEVHFDFYNELPNMQVTVSAEENTKPTKIIPINPAPPPPPEKYVLTLASLKNAAEVNQAKLSFLLDGIEVAVVKVDNGYRIQHGNYPTLAEAQAAQQELQKQGIDSVIEK